MRDLEKLVNVLKLLEFATIKVNLNDDTDRRYQQLESLGFGLYDSFHIACAEMAQADVLLSTDDRLLRNVSRHQGVIGIVVDNPVTWLMNVLQA